MSLHPAPAMRDILSADIRVDLLRVRTVCPVCRKAPTLAITPEVRARHMADDPSEVVGSVRCASGRCGTIYLIRAAAYQRAA